MTRKLIIQAVAAVFIMALAVSPGFTADGKGNPSRQSTTQDTHHDGISSGRDFGQHVSDHNDNFSGTHNPGRHHKGYSGIKK